MGPSGAGKSTLLNVLAGYRCNHAKDSIFINGQPRDMRIFRKMSRYIMQEDFTQPYLTVLESMEFAADLKLGSSVSPNHKHTIIENILQRMLLSKAKNTNTLKLSGGEKKRLSIALELIGNPQILFLDEPTTGLDDLSSLQCISLLKDLASDGQTIICSIHTPNEKMFKMFDHVYILSEGQCIYTGEGQHIVNYLSSIGLKCPKYYSPADFIIEVCSKEYGDYTNKMVKAVENGKCLRWCKDKNKVSLKSRSMQFSYKQSHLYDFSTSGLTQFKVLFKRMMIQNKRDYNFILYSFLTYLLIGLLIGCTFYKLGNNAYYAVYNYGFIFMTITAFSYLPLMPVLLKFPIEIRLLEREYFNRWYGMNAYFFALAVFKLFLAIFLTSVFICITYFLTGQPLELNRILKYFLVCLIVALSAESMGYTISSCFGITNSVFLGPCITCPFILLAGYGFGFKEYQIPFLIRIAMHFSYLRKGLEALVMAVYENRGKLVCPPSEDYCLINEPSELVRYIAMENVQYWISLSSLCGLFVVFKIMSYLLLRWRLSYGPIPLLGLSIVRRLVKAINNTLHR
ncbi:ATP-binding cassette sub-family G member 4-like isoform X2 [Daktulosphaira vitifoliae]|nr:ATP-binding cassette sub-family G member 4-like isoform X2 [Daktulosphaira vitifoliae]